MNTNKIDLIKAELERLKEETSIGLSEHENGVEQGRMEIINAISILLDSLQEESVSTKDKLLALSDGRLHFGWIDDAKVVEFEECLMQFHEDMNNIPQGTDSLTQLKDTDGVLHSYSKKLMSMAKEESVSEVWHDASKEPNDMSNCLIFYGDKNDVGHYRHYEPVLYNHQEKVFVTESFPHPTGYKVEQKSLDGGCVAEVYKDKRDRISISDITSWCYLNDLHNFTQKEEPVSEDLEEASKEWLKPQLDKSYANYGEAKMMELTHFDGYAMLDAIEFGANWKEQQFEKNRLAACDKQTEEEAEIERDFVMGVIEKEHRQPTFDDAIKYGMRLQRENMMKDATDVTVHVEAGNYPYIPQIELYDYDKDVPLANEGDRYKVILIKDGEL